MAAAAASGGDGGVRPCARESEGKRKWARERAREVWGGAWRRSGHPGDEGEDRQAGGVAARPCARAGHTPGRLAPGGRQRWWAGPAGPQVSTGRFFFISVSFLFF